MAYLAEERITKERTGSEVTYPVSATILNGGMIALDESGSARPAGNGTVSNVVAVALENAEPSGKKNILNTVRARRGCFGFDAAGLTVVDTGKVVYALDDHTVCPDSQHPVAGILIELEFTGNVYIAWVEIR